MTGQPFDEPPFDEEKQLKKIERKYGSIQAWQKEYRAQRKDDFEYEFKATTYLLAGHAAGLVGTLSFLKDYDEKKGLLKGLSFLIDAFAVGFIVSALAYVFFFVARQSVEASFEFDAPWPEQVLTVYRILQSVSLLILVLAVGGIAFRVNWL
jgi:hypothetical protein